MSANVSDGILDQLLELISQPNIKYEHKDNLKERCNTTSLYDELCDEIFERYLMFLRKTYNEPLSRINYEWSVRDKKALHLDWIHNLKYYDKWIPPNKDDFRYHFYSNLPFSAQHILHSTIPHSAYHIKLLDCHVEDWIPVLTIHHVALENNAERSIGKVVLVSMKANYKENISSDDLQIRAEGIIVNQGIKIKLITPTLEFSDIVESMDVTKYRCDANYPYLLTVKLRNQNVELCNIQKFVKESVEVLLNAKNLTKCNTNVATKYDYLSCQINNLPVKFIFSANVNKEIYPSHVMAILTNEQSIVVYPIIKASETEFYLEKLKKITIKPPIGTYFTDFSASICLPGTLPMIYSVDTSPSLKLFQLDGEKQPRLIITSSVPEHIDGQILGDYYKQCLKVDVNLRFPNLVAVGGVTETIWIYDMVKVLGSKRKNSAPANSTGEFETHKAGTDSFNNENNNTSRSRYVCGKDGGIYYTVIKPYLPTQVYNYFGPLHPVKKLRWIRGAEALLAVQYDKFIKVPNAHKIDGSNEHSVWAIWNVAKDVLSTDDAIMRNKYWIGNAKVATSKTINNSRLVALYNGHFDAKGGALATDFKWSNQVGLVAASTDTTRQLHVVKPGIWAWGDCDDELALARLESDVKFFQNSLKHIQGLVNKFILEESPLDSTRQRRTRARFKILENEAIEELERVKCGLKNPLKLEFLPEWFRKQVTLPSDRDKVVEKFV